MTKLDLAEHSGVKCYRDAYIDRHICGRNTTP